MTTVDLDRVLSIVDIALCIVDLVIVAILLAGRERPQRKPSRSAVLLSAYYSKKKGHFR